ncbi:hypothetical protein C8Q76DRAFT_762114 [Earliella scabrosa]|nr:hypothetical protein C8Q76DRAFT_762114 [Earliella scabrosa]
MEIPADIMVLNSFASDSADNSVTVRPPKRPASQLTGRAQARLIRQKMFEQEQEAEDREALGMTAVRIFFRPPLGCNHPCLLSARFG